MNISIDPQVPYSNVGLRSDEYELRDNRFLDIQPGDTLKIDEGKKLLHFEDFTIIAIADDDRVKRRLSWSVILKERYTYRIDLKGIRSQVEALDERYHLTTHKPLEEIIAHFALSSVLEKIICYCRLENRDDEPFLCVYQNTDLLKKFLLSPIELAWLAKL